MTIPLATYKPDFAPYIPIWEERNQVCLLAINKSCMTPNGMHDVLYAQHYGKQLLERPQSCPLYTGSGAQCKL